MLHYYILEDTDKHIGVSITAQVALSYDVRQDLKKILKGWKKGFGGIVVKYKGERVADGYLYKTNG